MLVASFVAGCIPLATKLSEAKLSFLTSLSVGLLISTSLVVIIPEGVETLYSNKSLSTDQHTHMADHTVVGLSLLIGFAVMFIIDQISSMHVHPPSSAASANIKHRNSLELDAILTDNTPTAPSTSSSPNTASVDTDDYQHASVTTPTIGLIVHAAADGIALGASASRPQLSMVVFFAIMLHKAPSAFALTTVLLSEGLSRTRVRQHLLMFSISAPAGAISTYLLMQFFSESFLTVNLEYWTGILLLFSGGTFLYVAMHAIQELPTSQGKADWRQMSSILLGMFIPFILNMNHSH
jgi:zinc transporter 9